MSLTSPPDLTITYNTHHEAYLRFSVGGSALSSSQKRFMCLERLHQPVDRFIVKVNNPESCNNIMSIDFLDIKLRTNGTRRNTLCKETFWKRK